MAEITTENPIVATVIKVVVVTTTEIRSVVIDLPTATMEKPWWQFCKETL